jgi:hypothetical protein
MQVSERDCLDNRAAISLLPGITEGTTASEYTSFVGRIQGADAVNEYSWPQLIKELGFVTIHLSLLQTPPFKTCPRETNFQSDDLSHYQVLICDNLGIRLSKRAKMHGRDESM